MTPCLVSSDPLVPAVGVDPDTIVRLVRRVCSDVRVDPSLMELRLHYLGDGGADLTVELQQLTKDLGPLLAAPAEIAVLWTPPLEESSRSLFYAGPNQLECEQLRAQRAVTLALEGLRSAGLDATQRRLVMQGLRTLGPAAAPAQGASDTNSVHEFAFDVFLRGAVRVRATTQKAAIAMLRRRLDAVQARVDEGTAVADPLAMEISLADDIQQPVAYEVDGREIQYRESADPDTLVGIFGDTIDAFEGEEQSVRQEHAALIGRMDRAWKQFQGQVLTPKELAQQWLPPDGRWRQASSVSDSAAGTAEFLFRDSDTPGREFVVTIEHGRVVEAEPLNDASMRERPRSA